MQAIQADTVSYTKCIDGIPIKWLPRWASITLLGEMFQLWILIHIYQFPAAIMVRDD